MEGYRAHCGILANTYPDGGAYGNADAHARTYGNAHARTYGNAHARTYGNAYARAYCYTYTRTYGNADARTYRYAYAIVVAKHEYVRRSLNRHTKPERASDYSG